VSLFITGTDTGVGKTHTLTELLRLLNASGMRCAGMKPICCGDRRDAEILLAASCEGLTIDEINPLWLQTPAAPFAAAAVENVRVVPHALLAAFAALQERVDQIFVEGVGGWMVPICENYYVRDLAAEIKLPVLVVAQNRLGCLNHILLTVESVQKSGLHCVGVVLNEIGSKSDVAKSTNREILERLLPVPILSVLA
jgi:dethiobiotin synthetase